MPRPSRLPQEGRGRLRDVLQGDQAHLRTLFPWLEEFGFKKCQHDSCIFKCEKEVNTPDGPRKEVLTLGVYVDDLVTLYFHDDEHSLYQQFATELQKWDVEDEGEVSLQ